jgi:hypothetical protein
MAIGDPRLTLMASGKQLCDRYTGLLVFSTGQWL